jgi:thiol-disulfide isomerase/thioredoxin
MKGQGLVRLAALGLALLGAAGPLGAQDEAGIRVGARAPVLPVHDLDGRAVDLGQWIGRKPVLLEFWATWCSNCEELLPRLQAAKALVGDRVEFVAVNVTVNQTPERVRRFLTEHAMPFQLLYDDQGASVRAYQAPATSFVVIADRSGTVVYTGLGGDQSFEPALRRVAGMGD